MVDKAAGNKIKFELGFEFLVNMYYFPSKPENPNVTRKWLFVVSLFCDSGLFFDI